MNSVLRKVARELKYRPLPELIDNTVTVESVSSVPLNVATMLARAFPLSVHFSGPQERWITVALAKYRVLDLTFIVDGVEWQPTDIPGIAILKEFGFILNADDISEEVRQAISEDDDPTYITTLDEDIGKNQIFLRLFLEEVPRRKSTEYLEELSKAGKRHLLKGGVAELEQLLDGFFPHEMALA